MFQQFYSMVDTIIVGRYLGVDALAAVGNTGSMAFLINGFIVGLTSGFSIMVAQKFGAKDEEGLKKSCVKFNNFKCSCCYNNYNNKYFKFKISIKSNEYTCKYN